MFKYKMVPRPQVWRRWLFLGVALSALGVCGFLGVLYYGNLEFYLFPVSLLLGIAAIIDSVRNRELLHEGSGDLGDASGPDAGV